MLEAESQEPSGLGIYNYGVAPIAPPHLPRTPIAELRYQRTLSSRLSVQMGESRPVSDAPKVSAETPLPSHIPVVVHHAFQTGLHRPLGNLASMAAGKVAGGIPRSPSITEVYFYLIFMGHGGIFVKKAFSIPPPEKSQQRSPSSLHSRGEQLGDGKPACCTPGAWTSVRVLQGIH